MNIFLTIDNNYAKYLAVTMASILYNLEKNKTINFFILDGGISEYNKIKINNLKKIKDFNIEYITVDKSKFEKIVSSSQAHISSETNYRFIISSLKQNLDKCLFLDADLIIDRDITELYNTDIDDYYMAAVPDQAPLDTFSWTHKLNLPENYRYVNTGVILVNLKKWREDNIEAKLFENVFNYSDVLMFPDQDTLNITLNSKVKYLSHIYNAMPVQNYVLKEEQKEAFNNPVIIHWAGFMKPWRFIEANCSHYFWKYARMTDFYEDIIYQNANVHYIDYTNNRINELSSKKITNNWNIADFIFSIKYTDIYKIITILGIKITTRQDKTRQDKTRQDKTRQDKT
ncbi:glycosyltransferase family 8 protein [Brachyspira intermedia]|uniref:glycosyltransferase family 8 protein n=1 Tax=Brachyspira intermedia TaxID=84377 RepID=UPI003003B488